MIAGALAVDLSSLFGKLDDHSRTWRAVRVGMIPATCGPGYTQHGYDACGSPIRGEFSTSGLPLEVPANRNINVADMMGGGTGQSQVGPIPIRHSRNRAWLRPVGYRQVPSP